MKHKAFTLVEILVLLVVLSILAALLLPMLGHGNHTRLSMERRQCQSNLRHLGLALRVYASDNDEKFPSHTAKYGGWEQLLSPYIKDAPVFSCPSTTDSSSTGYFTNARLSGVKRTRLAAPASVILGGDGAGWPSTYLTDLPTSWRKTATSPAWRHFDGANYLMADGTVKWLKSAEIAIGSSSKNQPTFEVKP